MYTGHHWVMPDQPKTPHRTVRIDDELWDAAKDKAKAEGVTVSDLVRDALRKAVGVSVPLVAALAMLLVWGGREVQDPWGETSGPAFSQAQVSGWADEIVGEQVASLGCSTVPALSVRVAVRPASGFDRGVVSLVSFDEGFRLAKAGKVFIVGWCA